MSYYNTLHETVNAAQLALNEADAVLPASGIHEEDFWVNQIFAAGHIAYGETRAHGFQLFSWKGKPTRKWFHIVIYRLDSGRYELTTYIL